MPRTSCGARFCHSLQCVMSRRAYAPDHLRCSWDLKSEWILRGAELRSSSPCGCVNSTAPNRAKSGDYRHGSLEGPCGICARRRESCRPRFNLVPGQMLGRCRLRPSEMSRRAQELLERWERPRCDYWEGRRVTRRDGSAEVGFDASGTKTSSDCEFCRKAASKT